MLAHSRHSHDSWNKCPRTHAKHAPSPTPSFADQAADDDSCAEANIVQTVEERQPRRRNLVSASLCIPVTKLRLKGRHGLSVVVSGIVKAIVEGRHGDDTEGQGQMPVEVVENSVLGQHGVDGTAIRVPRKDDCALALFRRRRIGAS